MTDCKTPTVCEAAITTALINNIEARALVDSGAEISLIAKAFCDMYGFLYVPSLKLHQP